MKFGLLNSTFETSILRDRCGNMAAMFAISLPLLLVGGAISSDYTSAVTLKARVNDAADSAAAAAAAAMLENGTNEDEAEALAIDFFNAQLAADFATFNRFSAQSSAEVTTLIDANGQETFDVTVSSSVSLDTNAITRLMLGQSLDVSVTAAAQSSPEALSAVSMFLVLDKSGSMGWDGKMAALKDAVSELMDQLDQAERGGAAGTLPLNAVRYVRTGAVAYDSATMTAEQIDWGTDGALDYANALYAEGGTNASSAMKTAYKKIRSESENALHLAESGRVPKRFILFMTDGANNYSSADTATRQWCNRAKGEDITVYTVAFQAPQRGEELLQNCASSSAHYFDADSSEELVSAFATIGKDAASQLARLTR